MWNIRDESVEDTCRECGSTTARAVFEETAVAVGARLHGGTCVVSFESCRGRKPDLLQHCSTAAFMSLNSAYLHETIDCSSASAAPSSLCSAGWTATAGEGRDNMTR